MKWYLILGYLCFAFALLGCLRQPKPATHTGSYGDFGIKIWVSDTCVRVGETVKVKATVTNNGSRTRVVELTDRPVFDIVIPALKPPVRWSEGKAMTPDLTRLELKPYQSKTIEMDWVAEQRAYGGVGILAQFVDEPNSPFGPRTVGGTVGVGTCPGTFGP